MDVYNITSLKLMAEKVQASTHVLIDDKSNFKKYIKALEIRDISKSEYFHFSEVIFRNPAGWIMPKNLEPILKEEINLNLQWLIDLGHYQYYKDAIDARLFRHIGIFFFHFLPLVTFQESIVPYKSASMPLSIRYVKSPFLLTNLESQ